MVHHNIYIHEHWQFCICILLEFAAPLLLLRAWEPWRVRTTAGLGSSLVNSSWPGKNGLIISNKNRYDTGDIIKGNKLNLKPTYRVDDPLWVPLWPNEGSCSVLFYLVRINHVGKQIIFRTFRISPIECPERSPLASVPKEKSKSPFPAAAESLPISGESAIACSPYTL